jgi:hypothetical protein
VKINDAYKPQSTSPLSSEKQAGKWQNTLSDATITSQHPTLKWPVKSCPEVGQVPTLESTKVLPLRNLKDLP